MKELEAQNARLRRAVAELTLDKLILKEAAIMDVLKSILGLAAHPALEPRLRPSRTLAPVPVSQSRTAGWRA